MKKVITDIIKHFKEMSFIEKLETIGGLLVLIYIPLFILLIWVDDCEFIIKLLLTNTALLIAIKFYVEAHE